MCVKTSQPSQAWILLNKLIAAFFGQNSNYSNESKARLLE